MKPKFANPQTSCRLKNMNYKAIREALDKHTMTVRNAADGDSYALCGCGWRSADYASRLAAAKVGESHLQDEINEAANK